MLIDLHTHTYPKSDDAFTDVDDLIEGAKAIGLDGICLTEHDAFWDPEEVRTLSRKHDFLVLPGSEINTDAGHVLVFGLERYVFGLHKPAQLAAAAQENGAVLIAAHPYRRRFLAGPGQDPGIRREMLQRAAADGLFQLCHAMESVNGRGAPVDNSFSHDLSELVQARTTGGSEAHRVSQLGTAATKPHSPITGLDDLIREIRGGRFEAVDLRDAG